MSLTLYLEADMEYNYLDRKTQKGVIEGKNLWGE